MSVFLFFTVCMIMWRMHQDKILTMEWRSVQLDEPITSFVGGHSVALAVDRLPTIAFD